MTVAELSQELPSGDAASLPALDAIAEGLRREGRDVEVAYVPREDCFRIVPREQVAS